ncbi:MAG TPA: hypothetical protein VMG34_11890 [Bacteroidota bacterium]|nr:hypothetical protein [Bacteroidota bacterium]
MAKVSKEKEKQSKRRLKKFENLPLDPINYKILIAGIAVIVAGYIALGTDPWDGFVALTIAPILLVLGYCVVIPFGIIYRPKKPAGEAQAESNIAEPVPPQHV